MLRDAGGVIFLLYRQSIPFVRFLCAITEAEACIRERVVIEGWYRRAAGWIWLNAVRQTPGRDRGCAIRGPLR